MPNIIIFDLDGTLANIDARRALSMDDNNKINWNKFFDPLNIPLDQPNQPVIHMAKMLKEQGFKIFIFSGRSGVTLQATVEWLQDNNIPCDKLMMRPKEKLFMKDADLKQLWLNDKELIPNISDVFAVFDDRDQVVEMWRKNGLTCFQVADGNF
jgi:phosphoglycolate phosphatase-like HAD superfamily hydrolase